MAKCSIFRQKLRLLHCRLRLSLYDDIDTRWCHFRLPVTLSAVLDFLLIARLTNSRIIIIFLFCYYYYLFIYFFITQVVKKLGVKN